MSAPLILIVGVVYLAVAIDQAAKGSWMGIAWLGYAVANVGLSLSAK